MLQPLPYTPGATLDVAWDWTAWLETGETIASFAVTAPAGITVDSSQEDAGKVAAWLTMRQTVAKGERLAAVCTISTSFGRTEAREIKLVARLR